MNKPCAMPGVSSLADFQAMFALDLAALPNSLLVFPAGIHSFGAELYHQGYSAVVNVDPYFDLSPMDMFKHVTFVLQGLSDQATTSGCAADINQWQAISQQFLSDYSVGQKEGRYRVANWDALVAEGQLFDLALCPDLFCQLAGQSIISVIERLLQCAREVRIFPIQSADGALLPELAPLMLTLQAANFGVALQEVKLPQAAKPSALLKVWSTGCPVS